MAEPQEPQDYSLSRAVSDPALRQTWAGRENAPEFVYGSSLRPFTGHPQDENRLMGPHPLSPVRRGYERPANGAASMTNLRKVRAACNFVLPSSICHTFVHEAQPDEGLKEFASWHTQMGVRRKHFRSPKSPVEKYKQHAVSSHMVGWHAESDYGKSLTRHPVNGLEESQTTKNYNNLVCTNMDKCLRSCK